MPVVPAMFSARITVWMASARTSQLLFRSWVSFVSFTDSSVVAWVVLLIAIRLCANATPMFLWVEESVRSLCSLEVVRVFAKVSRSEQEISRLDSAFSKRIGLILWGIVEDPTVFLVCFWVK